MEYSYIHVENKRLIDLKMPGSHNSNTYTFKSGANFISQNQTIDIYS